jgi:hydrogenase expression/formation protein HypC
MCLGIPGEVVAITDPVRNLATVEVAGVRRTVNVGLLDVGEVGPGDWVLIHVGFAMARIDEEEAARALEGLRLMGAAYDEELAAIKASRAD